MSHSEAHLQRIRVAQVNEITEHHVYARLSQHAKIAGTREVLAQIADHEMNHYEFLKGITGEDVEPNERRVRWYVFLSRRFGMNFGLRLLEKQSKKAEKIYKELAEEGNEEAQKIVQEEIEDEKKMLDMIDKKELDYIGSIVLGMNDALVEISGSLAGLTLALQNTRLIALTGLIVGIAASLSMAASEYLSSKEESKENPFTASLYTGIAYIVSVAIMVGPFFVLSNPFSALAVTIAAVVAIIAIFNYYVATAKGESFKRKFGEMVAISLGVALVSFVIGYLVRVFLGVEI